VSEFCVVFLKLLACSGVAVGLLVMYSDQIID